MFDVHKFPFRDKLIKEINYLCSYLSFGVYFFPYKWDQHAGKAILSFKLSSEWVDFYRLFHILLPTAQPRLWFWLLIFTFLIKFRGNLPNVMFVMSEKKCECCLSFLKKFHLLTGTSYSRRLVVSQDISPLSTQIRLYR